jgi:hypothetical protein
MPRTEPIDLSFFDSAPALFVDEWDIDVPADQFWPDLVDNPLHWCRGLKIRWTSPRPFGVGTTRHVAVFGALQADEHFFLWEEGVRFAFHFTHANLPIYRSLGEYYEVKPTGPGSCRFTWKIAAQPTLFGRAGSPITSALCSSFFRDTTKYVKTLGS